MGTKHSALASPCPPSGGSRRATEKSGATSPAPLPTHGPGLPTRLPTRLWSFGLRGVVLRLELMEAGLSVISRRAGGSRLLGARPGLLGSEGGSWGKKRSLRSGNPSPSVQEGRHDRSPREPPLGLEPSRDHQASICSPPACCASCSSSHSLSHVCLSSINEEHPLRGLSPAPRSPE